MSDLLSDIDVINRRTHIRSTFADVVVVVAIVDVVYRARLGVCLF